MKKFLAAFCALMLGLLAGNSAFAAYPDHPVTMIVPFGAGGSNDLPARFLASMLEKKLGQPIVVQNVVGAGGTIGTTQIAEAKPDGYTIGFDPTGALCLQPHMNKLAYGVDSFQFLGMVTQQPVTLMTGKNAPWKNLEEMVKIVKEAPGKYVVGISGRGNMSHVPVLALAKHYGLQFRYVTYRSTPEIMKEIAADRVQLHADNPVALSQYDVFGLIQFSDKKVDNLPMPNSKDIGLNNNFVMWQAVIAPKGLPKDVLDTLVKALDEVVHTPEYADGVRKLGINPWWLGPEDAQKFYSEEFAAYGEALKEAMSAGKEEKKEDKKP